MDRTESAAVAFGAKTARHGHPDPGGTVVQTPDATTPPSDVRPSRNDYLRGTRTGAGLRCRRDRPDDGGTLVVVGATTVYGLAWLSLLVFPMLASSRCWRPGSASSAGATCRAAGDGYGRSGRGAPAAVHPGGQPVDGRRPIWRRAQPRWRC